MKATRWGYVDIDGNSSTLNSHGDSWLSNSGENSSNQIALPLSLLDFTGQEGQNDANEDIFGYKRKPLHKKVRQKIISLKGPGCNYLYTYNSKTLQRSGVTIRFPGS
jgi:hypothetical protein